MQISDQDSVIGEFLRSRAAKRAAVRDRVPAEMDLIVARARDAIRAAKFDEPPLRVQRRMRDAMPEGMAATRANELWVWAREMLVERAKAAGRTEDEAQRVAALAMLLNDAAD
jgi:hypothetical protein